MENDNNLNKLVDRAVEDMSNNEEEKNTSNESPLELNGDDSNDYSGVFHERDSLSENNIVDEVEKSFLDYSMSVITSRAIPDLRDGLKPVHRRILWSMYNSGYTPDKPHRKSAKTVGEVMGNYHPHGDSSIYEAMVRMAQDFNQRYLLIDGHGNFGNIEGDGAAAMRYTESRLSKLSLELLSDIRKNTVDMTKNFDETLDEPVVLPSRFPNILVNGTMGIAVGMATNIPPHNLGEVIDGCVAYIDNPEIDTLGLMEHIKGPDFPTGGIILGNSGIKKAYETGRGSITLRSRAEIIEHNNHNSIVITEVPYGVNTMELKNKVAELVRDKVIDGISDYHTDLKDGVKITITLKRDANPQVVLNNLYKHTNFQIQYGIIFLMIDAGTPRTLGLKDIISKYIDYLQSFVADLPQNEIKAWCRNPSVNALLNYYETLLEMYGVRRQWEISLPDCKISDNDLCGMLGNLLENVYHGCLTAKEGERFHNFSVLLKNERDLYIVSSNSFDKEVRKKDGKYISSRKDGSGIGLSSIRITAEKYNGIARFSHDDKIFYIDIVMEV